MIPDAASITAPVPGDPAEVNRPAGGPLEYAQVESPSLREKTVRSSLWTFAGFGGSQVIRFCSSLIMMRLLMPHDFGLAALVGMFVNMFLQFSDIGLGPAIIQSPRGDDERFLNTAWTISVVRGVLLWLVTCALAWPIARYYQEPLLAPLIVVTGFTGVLSGMNATALFQLNRHMQVGKITALNLASQIVTTIVMITIAWWYQTVWSIILAGVVASIFTLIASHFLIPGFRNRFAWDRGAVREMVHFGGWILISTAVTLLANDVDRIIFGKIMTVALLGLYQQATMLVRMPIDLLGRLAGMSLFPALARGAEGGREELAGRLLRARRVILPLGVAAVVGLAFGAPPFVYVLYPGKFQEIGWMARYMSVGLWITILQLSSDRALLAIGHSKSLAMANVMNLMATITFAILGLRVGEYYRHAMPGFILGVAAGNLCGHLVVQSALAREHIWIYLQDLKYTLLLGVLGAVGIFLPRMLEQMLHRPYVQFQHMPSTKSGMWLIVRMGDLFRYQPIETIVGGIIVAAACAWAVARAVRGMR